MFVAVVKIPTFTTNDSQTRVFDVIYISYIN